MPASRRRGLESARLGHTEKVQGLKRLDRLTRAVEKRSQPLAGFSAALAHERRISASIGGRTVFDNLRRTSRKDQSIQGSLF
jgi:hypothetical protein